MIIGLGQVAAPQITQTSGPVGAGFDGLSSLSFTQGLSIWKSPMTALETIPFLFTTPSNLLTPVAMGLLLPPVALVVLFVSMGGKKR